LVDHLEAGVGAMTGMGSRDIGRHHVDSLPYIRAKGLAESVIHPSGDSLFRIVGCIQCGKNPHPPANTTQFGSAGTEVTCISTGHGLELPVMLGAAKDGGVVSPAQPEQESEPAVLYHLRIECQEALRHPNYETENENPWWAHGI
jgi:ribosomal protein S27E